MLASNDGQDIGVERRANDRAQRGCTLVGTIQPQNGARDAPNLRLRRVYTGLFPDGGPISGHSRRYWRALGGPKGGRGVGTRAGYRGGCKCNRRGIIHADTHFRKASRLSAGRLGHVVAQNKMRGPRRTSLRALDSRLSSARETVQAARGMHVAHSAPRSGRRTPTAGCY